MSAFAQSYERWAKARFSGDTAQALALEPALQAAYRTAWLTGDEVDRHAVVGFVYATREERGLELVVQGLDDPEERIANECAAIAYALLVDGIDFGPAIVDGLKRLLDRHPGQPTVVAALRVLEGRTSR